jgi:hypothetical protein
LCRACDKKFSIGSRLQAADGEFHAGKTVGTRAGRTRNVIGVGYGVAWGIRAFMNMAFELKATRLADIALQEASLNLGYQVSPED